MKRLFQGSQFSEKEKSINNFLGLFMRGEKSGLFYSVTTLTKAT